MLCSKTGTSCTLALADSSQVSFEACPVSRLSGGEVKMIVILENDYLVRIEALREAKIRISLELHHHAHQHVA
jgi:hypothetical protein